MAQNNEEKRFVVETETIVVRQYEIQADDVEDAKRFFAEHPFTIRPYLTKEHNEVIIDCYEKEKL